MSLLFRIIKMGRNYWTYLILSVVSILLLTLVQLYPPQVIRELIDQITNNNPSLGQNIGQMALLLAVAYAGQWIFGFLRSYLTHLAAWNFVSDIRVKAYDKLQELSLGYFHNKQTGQIMSRVANDSHEIESLIAHSIPDLFASVVTLIGIAIILLIINVGMALYSFITMPVFAYIAYKFAKNVYPHFRQAHQLRGEFYAILNDNISGMREIQAFNQQARELSKVNDKSRTHISYLLNALKLSAVFHPTMTFVSQLGTVIVVGYGGWLASMGQMPAKDIVAFLLYLSMFYQPISTLARLNEDMSNALAAAERVFELIDSESEVVDKEGAFDMPRAKGEISFKNISFSYVDGIPILKNLDLDIKAGDMIAFVGQTGVGKTTIASLLNRYYELKEGSIQIDGIDVRDVTLRSLRDNISMVMQDVFLFNGTIRENIAYGAAESTYEQIVDAAIKANADEFIVKLENGYDTIVGERGVKLSGGQKQRLAIARAILRDAPILILDEATSAVDMATERLIHKAIDVVAKDRTTIVIAHRLSTVRNANKIVVLKDGEIAEMGTHDELLLKNGLYRDFCRAQFED